MSWFDNINCTLVCFPCRKAARGWSAKCQHCGQPMRNMGKHFKTPKRDDLKEWERIELAVASGMSLKAGEIWRNWWNSQRGTPPPPRETLAAAKKRARQARIRNDLKDLHDYGTLKQSLIDKPPK